MTAEPDLDLAFEAAENLPESLVQPAADLCDPIGGIEPWHGLISGWLAQLSAELPESLQAPSYSLGLSLVCDEEIAALNSDWRDKAGPTDVLAFAARTTVSTMPPPSRCRTSTWRRDCSMPWSWATS